MLEIGDLHNIHVDGAYQEGQHLATDKDWTTIRFCMLVCMSASKQSTIQLELRLTEPTYKLPMSVLCLRLRAETSKGKAH